MKLPTYVTLVPYRFNAAYTWMAENINAPLILITDKRDTKMLAPGIGAALCIANVNRNDFSVSDVRFSSTCKITDVETFKIDAALEEVGLLSSKDGEHFICRFPFIEVVKFEYTAP